MIRHSSLRMNSRDHEELRLTGKTVSLEAVSLRFRLKNKVISGDTVPLCYAMVVSGKVASRAIDRNRLKRRGRAILQKLKPRLLQGSMGAFFFKKPALAKSFALLESDMTQLLVKAGLLAPLC